MRYGIISDTHRNPRTIPALVAALQQKGVDALVLNGDIGETLDHIAFTVGTAAESNLPVYVQPGSHEEVADYIAVMSAMTTSFKNVIDCLTYQKHEFGDHHLVFMPGSDWTAGGQFHLNNTIPTGTYVQTPKGLAPLSVEQVKTFMQNEEARPYLFVNTSFNDLDKHVTDAERTVLFCHIPARYANIATSVDMAYFSQTDEGVRPGIIMENRIKQLVGKVADKQLQFIAHYSGFPLKRENRGNPDLGAALVRNGVTKVISGHFHESAHRANDAASNAVAEGSFGDNLAYMASYADQGLAGIVTVKDNSIAYENIKLG